MEEFTYEDLENRCEVGKIENISVRFFMECIVEGDFTIIECTETEFEDFEGRIEYDRHSIFSNGCRQICLTKYRD